MRIAVAEVDRRLDDSHQFAVPANRVERLAVASPMEALIVAAGPVLVGAGLLLTRIIDARKSWWEGTKAKHEAHAAEEDVRRLRWERTRREVVGEIDLNGLANELARAVRAELGLPPSDEMPPEDDPALKALTTQASPALAELVEAGGGEVSFVRPDETAPGWTELL